MYNYRRKELNKRLPDHVKGYFHRATVHSGNAHFYGQTLQIFMGTRLRECAYTWRRRKSRN